MFIITIRFNKNNDLIGWMIQLHGKTGVYIFIVLIPAINVLSRHNCMYLTCKGKTENYLFS